MALLRERLAWRTPPARYGPDNSTLVAALVHDGNPQQAWIEAQAGGCRRDQWLNLARLREVEHPEDVLPIWREEVDLRKRNLMKLFAERGW